MIETVVRRVGMATVIAMACAACRPASRESLSDAQKAAIADTLRQLIAAAYDFSKGGDAVGRLMSLYPDSGRLVSAASGHITTSRDTLEMQIREFWTNVGQNMRNPNWTWGQTYVEVLSPNAAVLTATYRVPHVTPQGEPHVIGGAMTAVFERRNGKWVIVHEHLSDAPELR
jgi:ketosteroid isomerase-like protein